MRITLKEDDLENVLKDIEKHGFTSDGCACGDYAYQLDEKLFIHFYRSCRKSSSTPDEKLWHIHDIYFYEDGEWEHEEHNGVKYRYQFHPISKALKNVSINQKQLNEIISKLKEVTKKHYKHEYRNEY